jgi:aspartyl-tRNA(Asn)/glutamyl-tRNA(Gln) amidotransferase subunit C
VAVSREQVRHVARLARLELSSEEEERFAGQLSHILEAVEELVQVDTANVEPTAHATVAAAAFRDDVPRPSLPVEAAVGQAPAHGAGHFLVPKIIE